jgi:hypothetical protein
MDISKKEEEKVTNQYPKIAKPKQHGYINKNWQ